MKSENKKSDPKMDVTNLYREEVYTDRAAGVIRVLTPVKPDGSPDASRKPVYVGEAQLMTSVGALPLSFELEAKSLDEAVAKYGIGVKLAYEQAVAEIQEMRRRASSGLVIPEAGGGFGPGGGMGPGGMGPGGLPGGGKLTLP